MPHVQFVYHSGMRAWPSQLQSAFLRGSWDSQGMPSEEFHEFQMERTLCEDGCPAFAVTLSFPDSEVGNVFRWNVYVAQNGLIRLAIPEESNDYHSKDNVLEFKLGAEAATPQQESYRLNWSRHLGAQKCYRPGETQPRIRFSVWAPHAREVHVVMADLWENAVNDSAIDPTRTHALRPIPTERVAGGYVSDSGKGAHPSWGPFPMTRGKGGVWQTDLDDPALVSFEKFNHCPYMFRVVREDGSVAYRTDLYSRCQIGFGIEKPKGQYRCLTADLDGSVSCSVVKDPDAICRHFAEDRYPEQEWQRAEEFWKAQDGGQLPPRPTRVEDLVIYELHVGALGYGKPLDQPGTLQDTIDLLDYLKDLGVNAIELLPLAEFGGGGAAWGYSTSHYFAIEYAGGGRDKYKHFIRECHRRGLAVIIDVVFNHYSHDAERAEWMYDSTAHDRNIYYWYEASPNDYPKFDAAVDPAHRGQGGYVDNMSTGWAPRYWEPMVRRMFISSLLAHVTEFHIDGFRFDQTTSIHSYNALHANGAPVPSANVFGQKLLREATRALRLVKADVILMAEDHSNWSGVTHSPDQGGLGFDATWYSDFYHHLIGDTDKGSDYAKLLKTSGTGENGPLAMDYFASALASSGNSRIVYHESHDEAGNGRFTDRTINVAVNGAPLVGETRRVAESRVRVIAAITILSAGTPMFLFGEEVGATKKFCYGEVLANREDLHGLRASHGRDLFAFYSALIRLRLDLANAAFRSRNIEVVYSSNANRILAFRRWEGAQNFLVIASLNNAPFNNPNYTINSNRLGEERWREIFNSDSSSFGGLNVGNGSAVLPSGSERFSCALPANGILVFERT